jgi:high-affinity iron transporter
VALAVLREGSEIVLFLYGVIASGSSGASVFAGGVLGILAGAAFSVVTYYGLLAVPIRHILAVTGALIALLAAGMAAQAVVYLDAAGLITVLSNQLWDTSWILPQNSLIGKLLHTLIGYSDRPTELQFIVYVATIVVMLALMRLARTTQPARATA